MKNQRMRMPTLCALCLVAMGVITAKGINDSRVEGDGLYQRVSIKADADGVNGTTHEEWARVYGKLNLHYDVYANPRDDLSIEQMKTYLSN